LILARDAARCGFNNPFLACGTKVLSYLLFWIFALEERKNPKQDGFVI